MKAPFGEPSHIRPRVFAAALSGFAVFYLIQAATPLRIDDDAVDYLRMAAAITDRQPIPPIPLPHGFPILVSALERAGLGSSFFFVVANCGFLAVGLLSVWRMLRIYPTLVRQLTVVFTLLAVPVVKSVPIALPEAAFFGCSLLALPLISEAMSARNSKRAMLLIAAFVLTAAAISLRLVGAALIAPLLWVCLSREPEAASQQTRSRLRAALLLATLIVVTTLLAVAIARSHTAFVYWIWARRFYSTNGLMAALVTRVSWMANGLGEIVLNVPFSRFRSRRLLFAMVGIVAAAILAASVRRPGRLTTERLYVLIYFAALSLWPNPSPRLWMPVIPLLIAEVILAVDRLPRTRLRTVAVGAYAGWFALTGLAALAYTTRISFSGDQFSKVYGKSGGLANPEITADDPAWEHIKLYRIEAARVMSRYGGR